MSARQKTLTSRSGRATITSSEAAGGWLMPTSYGRVFKDRGDRWCIRLKNRIKICCDKNGETFYSKQHAQATLIRISAEIEAGTFDRDFYSRSKKSLLSFSVYASEWLQGYKRKVERGELAPTYLRSIKQYVSSMFIPYFGDTNIREIKGRQLKSFYLTLEQNPKTIVNIMSALKKLFRDALDDEVIEQMPNFPRNPRVPEPHWKWIDEESQDKILKEFDTDTHYAIYFLCCHGCRTGELRALKHSDLDLEHGTVTIQRAFSGTKLVETTKSKRSRVLPLDETWLELYFSRPIPINRDMFVFTKNGKPLSHTWLSKQWRKACDKLGIEGLTLYEGSRHSLASQAANRGESLYLIGKMLGHSTSKMTERYSHIESNALKQISRKSQKQSVRKVSAFEKRKS